MAKVKAVGIDLGTTYSAMAWVDEAGKSTLIPNEEGDLLTPSVALFEDKQVIVGKEAKKVAVVHPDRVAQFVKRDMGKPVYSKAIRGQYMPPEVIQSYILRKLKRDIERKIGPDFQVIITVPAYFDEPKRKATYQAGEMAGLKVLDILNEPTAAALAFGEDHGYLTRFGAPKERMKVLVYDLGGGTFDATLIDMQAGDLKTICTDGDVQLGGYDWDMRMVDFFATAFIKEKQLDPREDPSSMQRLLGLAEETKHTLTRRSKAVVEVSHAGVTIPVTIEREKYEELTADLLERTRYTTRQIVNTAGLDWKAVKRVLLTGGSTRMPMVQRMLRELTGLEPDHSVSPDEAVARGAAVYANYLLASRGPDEHKPTFDVTNVNAHSLGVEGIDPQTNRKRNRILIKRNTPLPARKTAECVTRHADQRTVVVQVLEGESLEPSQCSPIGRTIIRDLPPNLPKGWPIEVTYEYGVNGRLTVVAKVRGANREVKLELERDEAISADRLSRWKNTLGNEGGLDAFDMAIMEELETLRNQHAPGAGAKGASAAGPSMAPQARPQASPGAPLAGAGRPSTQMPSAQMPAGGSPQPMPARPYPAPLGAGGQPGGAGQGGAVPGMAAQSGAPQAAAGQGGAPRVPRLLSPGAGANPAAAGPGGIPRPPQQPAAPQTTVPRPAAAQPQQPMQPASPGGVSGLQSQVRFTCPHCRNVYQVLASLAGRQINCPGCRGMLMVPQPPPS